MKDQFKILLMILTCSVLIISALGCLNSSSYVFEGKIMTEDGSQPFGDANIYLELVNMTDYTQPTVMASKVFENGKEHNYIYALDCGEKLDPKGIYIISAFVDMDGDEKISSGDYVSTNPLLQRIEPNILEQKYDIYVYLKE